MKKIYFFFSAFFIIQSGYSQTVILGTGTGISAFSPFSRAYEYNVYEVIYPSAEIMIAGTINRFAFERVDGTNVDPIDSVSIYMQHTIQTDLSPGNFDTTGYTLVYQGPFPNDAGTGWREVTLTNPFAYDGLSNLQVLVVQGYQSAIATTPVSPRWYYTSQTNTPARRYYGSVAISGSTNLTTTNYRSNARLEISSVGLVEIGKKNIHLFPNPANEWINVKGEVKNGYLTILNGLGETVFSSLFNENSRIDIGQYSKGLYFLLLVDPSGNKVLTETFIKN
jgi:hypothetical protein